MGNLATKDKEFSSDLDKFIEKIAFYIPSVKKAGTNSLDVLATFIWQVSIVHSTDHFTQYKFFRHMPGGQEDGTVIKGGAISPTVVTKEWRECSEQLRKSGKAPTIEEVADRFDYIDRFRHFLDLFGQFNPSTGLNHTMDKIFSVDGGAVYNFSKPELNEEVSIFQKELTALEKSLKTMDNGLDGRGSLLCPLSAMSQSICF